MLKPRLLLAVVSLVARSCAFPSHQPHQSACSRTGIQDPRLPGARIQHLTASPVYNYSISTPQNGAGPSFDTAWTGLDFCNVTVTYMHVGHGKPVRVTVWLPLHGWNGRFQGTGGSGWVAGTGNEGLAPAVGLGYAAAETDGGHTEDRSAAPTWALDASGHINQYLLDMFGSVALNDLAIIGKTITKSFYGQGPRCSYWNGCSTGGRQGLMLAQKYPEAFDGIVANSPAIYWPELTVATFWPQQVMNKLGSYPEECELDFITRQATEACDGLDGVRDGIISSPDLCHFDATLLIDQSFTCYQTGRNTTISVQAALVANEIWSGATAPSGQKLWYGLYHEAPLTQHAATACSHNGTNCRGVPFPIGVGQLLYLVLKDPTFNLKTLTYLKYTSLFRASINQTSHVLSTTNPDLSAFAVRGGKMITTHGLADPAIFSVGTRRYYSSVLAGDEKAREYYRYFEAPGVGHCTNGVGGKGFYPRDTLGVVREWVEEAKVPEKLVGVRETGEERILCAWPERQVFVQEKGGV